MILKLNTFLTINIITGGLNEYFGDKASFFGTVSAIAGAFAFLCRLKLEAHITIVSSSETKFIDENIVRVLYPYDRFPDGLINVPQTM